jgi:hypothetical protein
MAILEEVNAEIEANRNRVYRFWFSAKQKRAREEFKTDDGKNNRKPLFVMIDGKKHEYTECMSGDHLERKSNWDDAVYLGEATWRNVIG